MKTGLVVEGGGMKCAYSAGILDGFLEDRIEFAYAIGVSAGSANTASFLAHQKGRNRRFYTEHIDDPEYFGLSSYRKTGNLFGLEYIYGTLTNSDGKDPLDYDAIMKNPCEFKLVATNARTGKPVYFDKSELIRNDYRHIMASCAIPGACAPVLIDGEYYYDGGISDSIPVAKALEDGCDRLVVLLSKPEGYVLRPKKPKSAYHLLCRQFPATVEKIENRHVMYTKEQGVLEELEKLGKAFVFRPSEPPKMSTYTMDKEVEEQLYLLGRKDYQKLRECLLKFMNND